MTIRPVPRLAICAILVGFARLAGDVQACNYTSVRDAAFTERRDVHWLCTLAWRHDSSAEAIHRHLAAWLERNGAGLNLELKLVAADDVNLAWEQDFGFPSAPTDQTPLPAVVLVGRISSERRGFFIEAWQPPRPSPDDLAQLLSSPAREAIRTAAMHSIAVLVHFTGGGSDASAAQRVIDAVVQYWKDKEKVGVSVVRVDRTDPRERILLSFAGVEPVGPDRVVVAFGRGKFMRTSEGQPLEGERLTVENLNSLIDLVIQECTCSTPPRSLGVDLPLLWDKSMEEQVTWLRDDQDRERSASPPETEIPVTGGPGVVARPIIGMALATLVGLALLAGMAAAVVVWGRYRARRRD